MLPAKIIVLEYLFPAAGVLVANIMYTAPYRDVKRAASEGRLGDLNPTPWAFMFFNCLGWLTYAVLIDNRFVFFGNVIPLIVSVWLNMIALELQYADHKITEIRRNIVLVLQDTHREARKKVTLDSSDHSKTPLDYAKIVWEIASLNTKAPVAHKTIIMFLTVLWTVVFCVILLARSCTPYTRELIVGVAVNLNLVFFYGAPLSTIFIMIKTRSCASIHPATLYTTFFNGFFWSAFGFAMVDWFIAIPNLLGAMLCAVQIVFCVIYPRKPSASVERSAACTKTDGRADNSPEQIDFYFSENGSVTAHLEFFVEGMDDVEKGSYHKEKDDATDQRNSDEGTASMPSVSTDQDSDKSSEQNDSSSGEESDEIEFFVEDINDVESFNDQGTTPNSSIFANPFAAELTAKILQADYHQDTCSAHVSVGEGNMVEDNHMSTNTICNGDESV
ncbi:hypothetical protein MPSEU_000241700 [Mayamaea pseudoterrestris]|nr:hypothetical protein MPSEU_000241700 [Mayamaea pseudoterrestris]